MKNSLILFLILMFPITLFAAKEPIGQKKAYLMNESNWHREKAIKALDSAKNLSVNIPDLVDRGKMEMLIGSIILSLRTSDIKTKILAVGLPLLVSFVTETATNMYDSYCEYKYLLADAEHHVQMILFYENMSVKLTNRVCDEADWYFCKAIDHITWVYKLVYVIKYEISSGGDVMRHAAAVELNKLRTRLVQILMKSDGKVDKRLSEYDFSAFDNIPEVLSELTDRSFRRRVNKCVNEAYKCIEKANDLWENSFYRREAVPESI